MVGGSCKGIGFDCFVKQVLSERHLVGMHLSLLWVSDVGQYLVQMHLRKRIMMLNVGAFVLPVFL